LRSEFVEKVEKACSGFTVENSYYHIQLLQQGTFFTDCQKLVDYKRYNENLYWNKGQVLEQVKECVPRGFEYGYLHDIKKSR
jgi:hypothetical protein